jgi:hypothetical protein
MNRTSTYLGPLVDIESGELQNYERRGGLIIEPKVDGMWAELIVGDPSRGRWHILNSRDGETGPVESDNRGDIHLQPIPLPPGSIIVGELEAATEWATEQKAMRGFRRFHMFDLIKIGKQNGYAEQLIGYHRALRDRRRLLNGLASEMATWKDESRFKLVDFYEDDFERRYWEWIEEGYEGAVIKPLDSFYTCTRSDRKTREWIRCKRWVTMDYVLWGIEMTPGGKHEPPKPTGAWGLYKNGKLTRVMKAAPLDPSHLTRANIGRLVTEFKGWAKFRSGALRHAQAVRVRTDKSPRMCTL